MNVVVCTCDSSSKGLKEPTRFIVLGETVAHNY